MGLRSLLKKRKEAMAAVPASRAAADISARPADAPHEYFPEPEKSPIRARVATWIDTLQRDPSAEERAAAERRALLLAELNRTVADAPDDVPIKYVIDRLNRHWDD